MKNYVTSLALVLLGVSPALAGLATVVKSSGITGGVVVHLGCAEGRDTVGLCPDDGYCVQGLDADAAQIAKARKFIRETAHQGNISFTTFDGVHLPYVDNMVNLIVAEQLDRVPEAELMRVLAPRGVAMIKKGGVWTRLTKPVPANIDQWTHYLHGPDNNAVANDTVVGPPRRLQWQGAPKWTRHHDCMSSLSALVSAEGRLFYIIDEGSTASIFLPSHWALIARDAFNGKILWKKKITDWYTRFKGLKSGPADAPRRLVAVGGRVYATLSLHGPVTSLDAVTGKTIREYAETQNAEEILVSGDLLLVLTGPGGNAANYRWTTTVPILVRAMALAGDTLFVAGPPDVLEEKSLGRNNPGTSKAAGAQEAAFDGRAGALLWAVSAKDGKRLANYQLTALPVFDGLAAANGCLYLSTTDGRVQCFQPVAQ